VKQKENILFITDKLYVDYEIPGGVQICTEEFIKYFETVGYNIIIIKISPNITLVKRLKLKFGIETYELYDEENYLKEIEDTIANNHIKLIFFNQLNLGHWATKIRQKTPSSIKCIGLSHGNESGDYIYQITKKDKTPTLLETWRIGKYLSKEKLLFTKTLDAVITISQQELYINQWLGAKKLLFLPRILNPKFIKWNPKKMTIGFIGTLDHYPNFNGIDQLAAQLQDKNFNGKLRLVGGPSHIGKKLDEKYHFISYCGQLNNTDLIAEIATWSIFVNPIFWYARGSSTKVAQIINSGLPILSTKAGLRGYELNNDAFTTQEDNPSELAELINSTLQSEYKIQQLKKIIEDNANCFDIKVYASSLSKFLNSL
jgi:Glycosyl transferases group 1